MVSHRNHLGAITASVMNFSIIIMNIDRTTDSNLIFGGVNGVKVMANNKLALYTGDYNGDGQIQNTDKNAVEPLRGISGYNNADVDMNGEVQNSD